MLFPVSFTPTSLTTRFRQFPLDASRFSQEGGKTEAQARARGPPRPHKEPLPRRSGMLRAPWALEPARFRHSPGILSRQLWNNAHCRALPSPAVTQKTVALGRGPQRRGAGRGGGQQGERTTGERLEAGRPPGPFPAAPGSLSWGCLQGDWQLFVSAPPHPPAGPPSSSPFQSLRPPLLLPPPSLFPSQPPACQG